MKRFITLILVLCILLTGCTAPDNGTVKQENIPKRLSSYTVSAAKKSPIVFESDVFGTIWYQLEDVNYLYKLPPTFELREDGLYHVGVKLDDDQGLSEHLRTTYDLGPLDSEGNYTAVETVKLSDITIVKVDVTITRTKEGNLPDFDANDEFPLDCLKIYVGLEGNKYKSVYTPLAAGGSNITYSDNVKLTTEIPISVTLYYAVQTLDFRHNDVCLSIQIADVADLNSKDISFISLADTSVISITSKNGNNGTVEGDGYFGIEYDGEIYYITNDYTSISSKYNNRYSGVGIYKQQEGEDEEIYVISDAFIAHKGFFDAVYHNGVIYFALREGYKNRIDQGSYEYYTQGTDADINLYSYDFENKTLKHLYHFTAGTNKYIQMKYVEEGLVYFFMFYDTQYPWHLEYGSSPTVEEMSELVNRNNQYTVSENFAINPQNRRMYRVEDDGRLTTLFNTEQVEFLGLYESIKTVMPDGILSQRVDGVTVYDTLEETGIEAVGSYDEDTRFLLVDMTVSYANPDNMDDKIEYEFDLVATTYPEMAEIARNLYPFAVQAPQIIGTEGVPDILEHGVKYPVRVLIAAHKDYVANRDIFLAETTNPPMSSLSPQKQFVQLLNTQLIEYSEKPMNDYGGTSWGYHDIEFKGIVYSYTNVVRTNSAGETYAEYDYTESVYGNIQSTGFSRDFALFSSNLLMQDGIVFYAKKHNDADEGWNFEDWDNGQIEIVGESLDCHIYSENDNRFGYSLGVDSTIKDIRMLYIKDNYLYFEIYRTVDGVDSVEIASLIVDNTPVIERELNIME